LAGTHISNWTLAKSRLQAQKPKPNPLENQDHDV